MDVAAAVFRFKVAALASVATNLPHLSIREQSSDTAA